MSTISSTPFMQCTIYAVVYLLRISYCTVVIAIIAAYVIKVLHKCDVIVSESYDPAAVDSSRATVSCYDKSFIVRAFCEINSRTGIRQTVR